MPSKPAARAASMPVRTWPGLPLRVSARRRLRAQAVQTDVDAPHPGGAQVMGAGGELGAVGGEDQFLQAGEGAQGVQ